jgi:hypothetical protein
MGRGPESRGERNLNGIEVRARLGKRPDMMGPPGPSWNLRTVRAPCLVRPAVRAELGEEVGDATHAFTQVVVTEREAQAHVTGRTECLAGNQRDLGFVEDEIG